MNQQKNENRNPQNDNSSNERTNQERGRNDLNPTDREFDFDEEKKKNMEVTAKTENPARDETLDKTDKPKALPRLEDPNINAENENRREKTGTMRNQPQPNRTLSGK